MTGAESLGQAVVKFGVDLAGFTQSITALASVVDGLANRIEAIAPVINSMSAAASTAGAQAGAAFNNAATGADKLSASIANASSEAARFDASNINAVEQQAVRANTSITTLAGGTGVMYAAAAAGADSLASGMGKTAASAATLASGVSASMGAVGTSIAAGASSFGGFTRAAQITQDSVLMIGHSASNAGRELTTFAGNSVAGITDLGEAIVRMAQAVPDDLPSRFRLPQLNLDLDAAVTRMDEFKTSLGSMSEGLNKVAMGTGAAAATIGGFLSASVHKAIQYESAFAGVRKTTEASESEFRQLSDSIRQLSKEIPVSAAELANYMEVAGQLGIAKENMLAYTKVVAEMGVATDLAGEEGAAALARLGLVAQVPQHEVSNLASAVVELGNTSAATEAEIVSMAQRLASAGSTAGLTAGDTVGLAAALSSVGIEAEAGGSAYSKVIIDMAETVDMGGERLEAFAKVAGLTAAEFASTWKDKPGDAIAAFVRGLNDMRESGGSVFALMNEMGFTEIRLRNALLSSGLAADKFTEYMKEGNVAYKENVALSKEAAERFKTAESKLQLLKNRFDDFRITVGNILLPELLEFVDDLGKKIGELAEYAEEYPEEFGERIRSLAKAAIGLTVFTAAAFAISTFTTAVIGTITIVSGLVKGIGLLHGAMTGAVAIPVAAVFFAWAAAATVLAAEIVVIGGAIIEAVQAWRQWGESTDALNNKADEMINKMEKQGIITKAQADEMRNLSDANEKAAAATAASTSAMSGYHAALDAQLQQELQNLLGREATIDELNRARIASENSKVTAAQAAELALSNLSTAELNRIALGTEKDIEASNKRVEYSKKVAEQQKTTTQVLLDATNAELGAMNQILATEADIVAAKTFAANNDITILDAVLAKRYNFTAEQIALIRQSAGAETEALLHVQLARQKDTDQLAAELAAKGQSLAEFQEWNLARIEELRIRRAEIIAEVQGLQEIAADEHRKLTDEEMARLSTLQEAYKQNADATKVALEYRRDINVAVERKIAEEAAVTAGVEKDVADARIAQGDAMAVALQELATKHGEYTDKVLSSNAAAADAFNRASGDTQSEIRGMIAMWAESGTSVEDAVAKWSAAYSKLPPSKSGAGNILDALREDFGSIGKLFGSISNEINERMTDIHKSQMFFAPSTHGSPSPLEVTISDFELLKNELDSLVRANEQALYRMETVWRNYANAMQVTSQNVLGSLQKMDPTVRHSPSILDNVQFGAAEMLRQWQTYASKLMRPMLDVYDTLQYANPLAHHSPSLLEQVIKGWDQMNEAERAAIMKKWHMFRNIYRTELAILQKHFAAGGGELQLAVERSPLSGAIQSAQFTGGPTELLERGGLYDIRGFINTLQKLFGSAKDHTTGMNVLATLLKQEALSGSQETIAKPLRESVDLQQQILASQEQQRIQQEQLLRIQGAVRGPGFSGSAYANLGALSGDVIARILELLQGGQLDPTTVPPVLTSRAAKDSIITIPINIENVRSEADIMGIAERVYDKLRRSEFRRR